MSCRSLWAEAQAGSESAGVVIVAVAAVGIEAVAAAGGTKTAVAAIRSIGAASCRTQSAVAAFVAR